jgi:hypothetical protein
MPRKVSKEENLRPAYLNSDGTLSFDKIFKFQAKQTELLRNVSRGGVPYLMTAAPQCLSVGGIRSGKTSGWLMYLVQNYCLAFEKCDILILRRTFKELESGAIADFKTFVPAELYTYNPVSHVATFVNGSRVVFGHCVNNKDRDIEQYLGQAFPGILVDECGQFSSEAWMMLYSRNIVNASCLPDKHGNLPIPCIIGCTNPLGPFYEYYRTVFVQKEPWNKPENAQKDIAGAWWVLEAGEWRCIYDPKAYAFQRSTVMDNPELLKRDPGILSRLNSLPEAKRNKMLLGLDGVTEGQYFDVFSEDYHVVNLREDPDAIIWLPYQAVWGSQDWGMGHHNAAYLFTKALVKMVNGDRKLKVVCFKEMVTSGGKSHKEWAAMLAHNARFLPDGITPIKLKNIYFSHEKFSRVMDAHTPADEYSRELKALGLPAVTRGTTDRVGSASLMYNMFKNGEIVLLDVCKDLIRAIPSLMRNPDMLDDVLKVDSKGDDCYDGFRLGLYGQLATRKKPDEQTIKEYADKLSPFERHFYLMKVAADRERQSEVFTQPKIPMWQVKEINQ